MFCFPYAGGGASLYAAWKSHLPEDIELCPVQLPGRETRLGEPSFTRMKPLVDELCKVLLSYMDLPYAMFGHSTGAVVAYATALQFKARWNLSPLHLFVSARRAPHLPSTEQAVHTLSDDGIIEKLRQLQGTPEEIFDSPELLTLLLPVLRADLELNDKYVSDIGEKLDCPVTAIGAIKDKHVTAKELDAWRMTTRGSFQSYLFPGDHFFIRQQVHEVTTVIKNTGVVCP